jgi:hypothetical protein
LLTILGNKFQPSLTIVLLTESEFSSGDCIDSTLTSL